MNDHQLEAPAPSQRTGAVPATGANADYLTTIAMVFIGAGVLAIVLAAVRRRNKHRHA